MLAWLLSTNNERYKAGSIRGDYFNDTDESTFLGSSIVECTCCATLALKGAHVPATAYHIMESIERMHEYIIVVFLPNSSENTKLISAPTERKCIGHVSYRSEIAVRESGADCSAYQQLRLQRIMLGSGP